MNTEKNAKSGSLEPMVRLLVWIIGFRPGNRRRDERHGVMRLQQWPEALWEYAPTGDFWSLTVSVAKVPCFPQRWMQRIAFGVRYRMLPNSD